MRISARLVTYGYAGTVSSPSRHISLTSEKEVKSAKKRPNGLRGVRLIRDDDEAKRAIILNPTLTFPGIANRRAGWVANSGAITNLDEWPTASGGYVIGHGIVNQPSSYSSVAYQIRENDAISIQGFLGKPDGKRPVWTTRWNGWQFQIIAGRASLMKLSPTWSQGIEDDVNTLQAQEEIDEVTADLINEKLKQLYTISEDISIEPGGDGWYGTAWSLTFLPEPSGVVNVILGEDAKWQQQAVEVPEVQAARQDGTVWGAGPLMLRSSEGVWWCRVGYPTFPAKGQLAGSPFRYPWDLEADPVYSFLGSRPPGTGISVEMTSLDNSGINNELTVTLTTSDLRKTPFLYSADATIENGPLPWSSSVSFDTADHGSVIKNVRPQLEGDMRRSQYEIDIRDVNGGTLSALGNRYEFLENRLCDLYIDGQRVITGGLVKVSQGANRRRLKENLGRTATTRPDGEFTPQVMDGWGLLEERILQQGEIIGDGLRLGAMVRRALRLAGYTNAQMAGVSVNFGRYLPSAVYGEKYCIESQQDQNIADFIRDNMDRYGMGAIVWQDGATGIWHLGKRSTSLAKVDGHDAVFECKHALNVNLNIYPDRFVIKHPLDCLRDTSDFYNEYTIEGAEDADGNPIAYRETLYESIKGPPGNTQSPLFIGRWKPASRVYDDTIRTMSDAVWIGRSLGERYSKRPPRFNSGRSYFHKGLFPGDRIVIDDIECEITRISGDISDDTSEITAQEVL